MEDPARTVEKLLRLAASATGAERAAAQSAAKKILDAHGLRVLPDGRVVPKLRIYVNPDDWDRFAARAKKFLSAMITSSKEAAADAPPPRRTWDLGDTVSYTAGRSARGARRARRGR